MGNLWVGDINALYKISADYISSIHKRHLTTIDISPFASFTKRVYGLAADKDQNIYAGSFDGVFSIKANVNSFELIWRNPDPVHFVRSVAAISTDSVFWNCNDQHPTQMIMGKIKTTFTEDFLGRTIFTYKHKVYALTTSGVGSFKNGVVRPLALFGKITNNAVAALVDAEENIWLASWEGLLKFRKTAFHQFTLQHNEQKEAFSFLERKKGDVLFGSNRGIVFSKKQEAIVPDKTIPALFPLAEVMCMYEDTEGGLWAGSGYQGISRFKNGKLTNWRYTGFLKDNNCEALYPAANGRLFDCTENGVTVVDPLAAEPMTAHYPFQKKYTRPPELFGCFQTGNSGYWFYGSQGLYKLENGQLADDSIITMPVKNLYINKIISDKKGNICITTQGK
ncbi:MAG: hypothetical protein AAB221_01770 [Bacteroidota bacterium]